MVFAIDGSANTGGVTSVNGVDFVSATRADALSEAQAQSPGGESLFTTLANDNLSAFGTGGLGDVGTSSEADGGERMPETQPR